jgi:hypothetical protein
MKLMCDLARLHQFISRRLFSSANCTVIPTFALLVGNKSANPEEALAAFSSWGMVLGSNASYNRMALSLVDNHFGKSSIAAPVEPSRLTPSTKRPRESGPAAGQPIPALPPYASRVYGFTRGGTRGASNSSNRGFQRGFQEVSG